MLTAMDMQGMKQLIRVAKGEEKAPLVLRNANVLNVFTHSWENKDIAIVQGRIAGLGCYEGLAERDLHGSKVAPAFIDGHIHLESSLLSPAMFCQSVACHGTSAVVCDPHELANVLGLDGIRYMLQATEGLPLDVFVMLPSCVPATDEDESFTTLTADDLETLLVHPRVLGLAEMMNYPGLLGGSPLVLNKLLMARSHGLVVDGHAPAVTGKELQAYIASGVGSDHECTTYEQGLEKLSNGQWLMMREGTAAQNLKALLPLLRPPYASRCLFVTDDKHPAELKKDGHIDGMVKMAIREGADPIDALMAASWNAAQAFRLHDRGAIAPSYLADLVVIDDEYNVQSTYKDGKLLYDGQPITVDMPVIDTALQEKALHSFHMSPIQAECFASGSSLGVLKMVEGQILTENGGMAEEVDVSLDRLKIAVLERHHATGHIGIGYLTGYGLKQGAIATSIAHDSHNLIVVGDNDADMACAAERVRSLGGGIALALDGKVVGDLALPIAGLMTDQDSDSVDQQMVQLKNRAEKMGVCKGIDPFMTLSFMSLPVIPAMRVLTHGVFDVNAWRYVSRS